MKNANKYLDIVLLTVFGLFLILSVYQHFINGSVLSVNNAFAAVAVIVGFILNFNRSKRGRYVVLVLLLLSTFGIINFVGAVTRIGDAVINKDIYLQYPGIDPISLIILVVYCFVNKALFWECYSLIFRGSHEEQENIRDGKIKLYYEKFNNCDAAEFESIYNNKDAYPSEAQIALSKVNEERSISLTTH